MKKSAVNVNNHMNINLNQYMVLVSRRDWAGTDNDGKPATMEQGVVVEFKLSGVPQPRLAPKKGEMDLWSVTVQTDNGGHVDIRLDYIIAAFHAQPAPPPAPPAQPVPQEGEFIPAAAKPPRKPRARKPAAQ